MFSEKWKHFDPVLVCCVFFGGAAVMVFELVGSRLLAPYVGTSLYAWTSLIGVMLGSMGIGYTVGGIYADNVPTRSALARVLFFAALAVAWAALLKDTGSQMVSSFPLPIELKSLLISLVLFTPASICMAMITPFAIKLTLLDLHRAGFESGVLYAISTAGSIVGTFLAGLLLIPFLGSFKTLLVIIGILLVMAAVLFGKKYWDRKIRKGSLLLAFMILSAVAIDKTTTSFFVAVKDTAYNHIQLFHFQDPVTGKQALGLSTDPSGVQAGLFTDGTDDLVFAYTKFYRLSELLVPDAQYALMIGGCAYTYPRDFLEKFPLAKMDVVEIDPGMTQVARTYFGLKDDPRLMIRHEDGRVFLNENKNVYDVVFMDAFNTNFNIPYQLTTLEAVEKMSSALNERGIVLANIISSVDGTRSKFLQAEYETYRQVFPYVSVFSVNNQPRDETQNLMLLASKKPIDFSSHASDPLWMPYTSHLLATESLSHTLAALSDDLAPTEFYLRLSLN